MIPRWLFGPYRNGWVHANRSQGGQQASGKRHRDCKYDGCGKRRYVPGSDASQQGLEQPAGAIGEHDSNYDSNGRALESLSHREIDDVDTPGAERDSDPDLLGAARYGERQQAVNPDRGEKERNRAERTEYSQLQAARFGLVLNDISKRLHFRNGLRAIGFPNYPPQRGNERNRITRGSKRQVFRRIPGCNVVGLLPRHVNLGLAASLQTANVNVAHHADHNSIVVADIDVAAKRILIRPVASYKRLAYQRYIGCMMSVFLRYIVAPLAAGCAWL